MKNIFLVCFLLIFSNSVFAQQCFIPGEPSVDCGNGVFLCAEKGSEILRGVSDIFLAMDGFIAITVGLSNQNHPGCVITGTFESSSNLENIKKVFPNGIKYQSFDVEFEVGQIPHPVPFK